MKATKHSLRRSLLGCFNNMNMVKKLVFIYLFAVLLPFLAAGLFYTYYTSDLIEEKTVLELKSDISHYSNNLNTLIMTYSTLANSVANNQTLILALENRYDNVIDALELYQEIWQQYKNNVQSWPYIKNITLYTTNDTLHNSYPYLIRTDTYMEQLPEYPLMVGSGARGLWSASRSTAKQEFWNPANSSKVLLGARTFTFNRVINSARIFTQPIGLLTLEIKIDAIDDIIRTEAANIYILDQADNIVTYSGKEWHLEHAHALKLFDDGNSTPVRHTIDGIDYYVDSIELSNGWHVMLTKSLDEAFAQSKAIGLYGAVIFLFISLLIIMLILFFSQLISRRSHRLINKMELFMNSELMLGEDIGGNDEFGVLDERFTELAKELKNTIEQTYVLQLQKKEYHLQMLQAQINPHFLYNTLSTIAWLSDNNPREEVRSAVENLAVFYRATLSKGRQIITLDEELTGLKAYIELQKKRYLNRLTVYYHVDELVMEASIPSLTLQPLVENCIQHGLGGEKENISIDVSAHMVDNRLSIKIQDDGKGMTSEQLEALRQGIVERTEGSGLGYRNVDGRIKQHYGEQFGLQVCSVSNVGTTVTINLPF